MMTRNLILVAVIALLSAERQLPIKTVVSPVPPTLEVREFATWAAAASLNDGGLTKEFRWSTTRQDAALGRYEVAYGLLGSLNGELPLPKPLGAHGFFSIDFTPLLKQLAGSPSPKKLFHVRVTLLDRAGNPLLPASQIVALTYQPPAGGTTLDSTIALILRSVKCIETTDGIGSDQVRIRILAASLSAGGSGKDLFNTVKAGFGAGDVFAPNTLLHSFSGLSFTGQPAILVGLAEQDGINFGMSKEGSATPSGPDALHSLKAQLCMGEQDEDDCIGDPQVLPLTAEDWNKAVVKKQVVTKKLVFTGDGGRYEVVFELRKS